MIHDVPSGYVKIAIENGLVNLHFAIENGHLEYGYSDILGYG